MVIILILHACMNSIQSNLLDNSKKDPRFIIFPAIWFRDLIRKVQRLEFLYFSSRTAWNPWKCAGTILKRNDRNSKNLELFQVRFVTPECRNFRGWPAVLIRGPVHSLTISWYQLSLCNAVLRFFEFDFYNLASLYISGSFEEVHGIKLSRV